VEQLVNNKKTASIEMQWKEDNADIHSETEKSMDHCDIKDFLKLSRDEVGKSKTKSDEVISHVKDREVRAEEVGRITDDRRQIGRTSSRQIKPPQQEARIFYGRSNFR
jgi:hydrogenase maturation factor HypE